MATSKEFADYALQQLHLLSEVAYRKMMGEYVLYYRGKVVGGFYDNRLLLKATPSVLTHLSQGELVIPYPGAKEMFFVPDLQDPQWLKELVEPMFLELPFPQKRSKKKPSVR